MLLCAVLSIGAVVLLIFTTSLMTNRITGPKLSLSRNLHVSHHDTATAGGDARVRHWMSLDWFMQPSLTHTDIYYPAITSTRTTDGEAYVSMLPWQFADACPPPRASVETWEENTRLVNRDKMNAQFFCLPGDTDQTNCPLEKDAKTFYPNPLMYFACRASRTPTLAMFEVDSHAWSFASAHSAIALVFFIQAVILIIAVYQTLRWFFTWKSEALREKESSSGMELSEDSKTELKKLASTLVVLLIALVIGVVIWAIILRLNITSLENFVSGDTAKSSATVHSSLYTRPLPNGSFLYGMFSFFVAAFCCVQHLEGVLCSSYGQYTMDVDMIDDSEEIPRIPTIENGSVSTPQSVEGTSTSRMTQNTLDTSTFMGSKKISLAAYQKNVTDLNSKSKLPTFTDDDNQVVAGICKILEAPRFKQSMWSVAQVCLLPLWLLAANGIASAFDTDVNTQLVLVSAFVLGVSDVYLDRFATIVHACNLLQENMIFNVESFVAASVIMVQIVLVIIINFCTGWRSTEYALQGSVDTMRTVDASFGANTARTLNGTGVWLFNIYFGVALLLKIAKTWFRDRSDEQAAGKRTETWMKKSWFSVRTLDELLLFVLFVMVYLYSLAVAATINGSPDWFASPHTTFGSLEGGMTSEELAAIYWQGDWTKLQPS